MILRPTFFQTNNKFLILLKALPLKHIYCLSGLGADEKIFSRLDFQNHHVTFLQWLTPERSETIANYSKRLSIKLSFPNPILIGISFGGIMCIEIAKHIAVEKIILISSIKTSDELPLWMKTAGRLHLNKIFPMRSFKLIEPLEDYNLGVETVEEKSIVHRYRRTVEKTYVEWAIDCLLNWKSRAVPSNLIHIHGDNDRIFNVGKLKPDHIIKTGGHLMVMNRAAEVNAILLKIINDK